MTVSTKSVFEILIREHTEMLLAFIRSGIRDQHAVDDLYQETVLTAWRRLEAYESERPFGPWLRGIAGKLILAFYRQAARAPHALDEGSLQWLEQRFEAIHQQPGDTFYEKLSALRDCLHALPEAYSRPISMRYTEQMTPTQIAEQLRLALDTLRKRLTRGKARLADCLERKLGLSGTPL